MIETEEIKKAEEQYGANSIQVLEGLEAVRKRPSMYIGDISERGLHHLVYEVVDNSIDEAMGGFCTDINVSILPGNSIRVEDNGRGIPTGMHEKEHRSALEVVLTVLHAGGKFSKNSYKVSGGLHGVGVSCVNALSDSLVAEVHREGKIFKQSYSKGKPLGPVEVVGESDNTGTIITFHPDPEIFVQTTVYRYDTLAARLRELAYLNKGVKITLCDKRELIDEYVTDENGNTSQQYDTDAIYKSVKNFVDDYNSVLGMVNYTKMESNMLSKLGITVGSDYQMSMDENAFKKSDMSVAKSLFNGTGSYAYMIGSKSAMTNSYADMEAARANTYNRYGSYGNTYNSGSIYNSYF